MSDVDPVLGAAMRRQLAARPDGATRVGGKYGSGDGERVAAVLRVLGAVGERLEAGDRLITGLIVNTQVEGGDEVVADLGALGRVTLRVA